MSRSQRFGLLGIALVIAIVAAVIIIVSSGGDDSTTDSAGATIEVKDAKPVGGVQTLTYKKGGTIDFTVKSDTADEIHFHGYDVGKDIDAGGSVQFKVPATIDGEFEVELEEHKEQIASVKVEP